MATISDNRVYDVVELRTVNECTNPVQLACIDNIVFYVKCTGSWAILYNSEALENKQYSTIDNLVEYIMERNNSKMSSNIIIDKTNTSITYEEMFLECI